MHKKFHSDIDQIDNVYMFRDGFNKYLFHFCVIILLFSRRFIN